MKFTAVITVIIDVPDTLKDRKDAYGDPDISPRAAAAVEMERISIIHKDDLEVTHMWQIEDVPDKWPD